MRQSLVWAVLIASAAACALSEAIVFQSTSPPDATAAALGGLWIAMPFLAAAGLAVLLRRHTAALVTLIGEGTRLLVMAGLLWAGGDLTLLIIDAGHDLRVARILLGRINTQLHANSSASQPAPPPVVTTPPTRRD